MLVRAVTLVTSFALVTLVASKKCGYEACPSVEPGVLNMHLVLHTHNDVGWTMTVDEYFYGSESQFQSPSVKNIIDRVVAELLKDTSRRFVYAETSYLWKWWELQSDARREQVRTLVNDGRLEIVGGGWTMNDEAVSHYQSIIDQMTWGFRRLKAMFGVCGQPRVAWQIDTFEHSQEMGSILAHMGYDGVFFGRVHYQAMEKLLELKEAEMVWKTSDNLQTANLFTHVLYNRYNSPPGFCFDTNCYDIHVIENLEQRVNRLVSFAKQQSQKYLTNNVILTFGGDFTFENAKKWYIALDKIITYIKQNNNTEINAFYSTPSCYLKAVNDEGNSWPAKVGDFFPYASESNKYWTGYYSSKPTIKYFERLGNNFLQICKQLHALSRLGTGNSHNLNVLREAMGVMQHHDAITGTNTDHTAQDYYRMLTEGFHKCEIVVKSTINKHIAKGEKLSLPKWESCLLLNISQCGPSESSSSFVVTIYNPLSRTVSPYVRFPVSGLSYNIKDHTGRTVPNQLVPIPPPVRSVPGRKSIAVSELVFRAIDLPPMGFHSYFVSQDDSESSTFNSRETKTSELSFGHKKFHFVTDEDGDIVELFSRGEKFKFSEKYAFYKGSKEHSLTERTSGAYVLNQKNLDTNTFYNGTVHQTYRGPLVTERHEIFNEWLSQIIRIYSKEEHAEIEWLVGPIVIRDHVSKEVIVKYKTDFSSEGRFFTDSNGREMMERTRNDRTEDTTAFENFVGGNYYPVTNRILIRDPQRNLQISVVTDRSQGGSSLEDGELELMLHRRLLKDDDLGVKEPLNETAFNHGLVVRGKHYLTGGPSSSSLTVYEKLMAQEKLLQPWLLFSPADDYSFESWSDNFAMQFTGIKKLLPKNVHILTLEPWRDQKLLIRLEHILEVGEDPKLSIPVTVNLENLFAPFIVSEARETTLGGNQWLADFKRLKWNVDSNSNVADTHTLKRRRRSAEETLSVTLYPMQIRSFVITVDYNTD